MSSQAKEEGVRERESVCARACARVKARECELHEGQGQGLFTAVPSTPRTVPGSKKALSKDLLTDEWLDGGCLHLPFWW